MPTLGEATKQDARVRSGRTAPILSGARAFAGPSAPLSTRAPQRIGPERRHRAAPFRGTTGVAAR
jgi:hypothetical protein